MQKELLFGQSNSETAQILTWAPKQARVCPFLFSFVFVLTCISPIGFHLSIYFVIIMLFKIACYYHIHTHIYLEREEFGDKMIIVDGKLKKMDE